eukprot:364871-Chlamydomonas_euryale.AAC.5
MMCACFGLTWQPSGGQELSQLRQKLRQAEIRAKHLEQGVGDGERAGGKDEELLKRARVRCAQAWVEGSSAKRYRRRRQKARPRPGTSTILHAGMPSCKLACTLGALGGNKHAWECMLAC